MKKGTLWILIFTALMVAAAFAPGGFAAALALPFTALGAMLRTLSLSGGVGNAGAIAVFGLLCLIPAALFLRTKRQREDWLLLLLVPVLGFSLYLMINPGLRPPMLQNEVGDITYAGAVWSVVITWGVLKLIRSSDRILSEHVYRALRIFLLICAAQMLIDGVGVGLRDCLTQIAYIRERANTTFVSPMPNYIFITLGFAVEAAEGILTALVLWKGAKLLEAMERDPYSAETVEASRDVGKWCRQMLVIVSLSALALNLGQIMMAGFLVNASTTVRIPVASLAIAFGMLALTRLLVQGKALKDESELFI